MLKINKKPNYFKSIFIGMSALTLPTFFNNSNIPKVSLSTLTDSQKVQLDYLHSTKEIKAKVEEFGYTK